MAKTDTRIYSNEPCGRKLEVRLTKIIGKMVFKFPMYAVHDLKTKIFGNISLLPFSDESNNRKYFFLNHIFMLLEAYQV